MNDAPKSPKIRACRQAACLTAGSLLIAGPAGAIELGEIDVASGLGQPLRASIAFALAPNEQVSEQCVYLRAGNPGSGLPQITRARTTLSGNRILLEGDVALREPMMSLSVIVDCPYTAHLRRDYLLLLDPPAPAGEAVRASGPVDDARRPVNVFEPAPAPQAVARRPALPVAPGTAYVVRPGDTVSEIASRIEDRRVTLWPAVDAIVAANPQAFVGGDPDRLIAGVTLEIPASLGGTVAAPSAAAEAPAAPAARAYGGVREVTRQASTPPVEPAAATPAELAREPVPTESPATATATRGETPAAEADVTETTFTDTDVLEPATPAAAEAAPEPVIDIPDTVVVQPAPEPIPVAAAREDSPAQSWLVWLGGSGVAIFLALLLFGRWLRERFGTPAALRAGDDLEETEVNEALSFNRRASDRGEPEPEPAIDLADTLGPADEIQVEEMQAEDDDGDYGADDVDVALDYSFASSGEYSQAVDFDVGDEGDTVETQARPAKPKSAAEVDTSTGNYDMSMIIDATKQDFGTGRQRPANLEAIEVEALDSRPRRSPALDLTTEFDYHILEQDYEEELTQTQALNRDIEDAARELQLELGEFERQEREDPDDRSRISMAEDLDGTAEVTAEMPTEVLPEESDAGNEPLGNADDTDRTEALTSRLKDSDETVEMELEEDETVERRTKAG